MPPFPWMRNAGTGILRINEEHDLMLRLLEQISSGVSNKDLPGATKAARLFAEAALLHFSHEEMLMANVKYPQAQQHIKAHDDARKSVNELLSAVTSRSNNENIFRMVNDTASTLHNKLFSDDIDLVRFLESLRAY